jgi:hypothetical protein
MLFKTTQAFAALMLISSALALALPNAEPEANPVEIIVEGETFVEFAEIQCQNERHGLKPICPMLNKTEDRGCIRCEDGILFWRSFADRFCRREGI